MNIKPLFIAAVLLASAQAGVAHRPAAAAAPAHAAAAAAAVPPGPVQALYQTRFVDARARATAKTQDWVFIREGDTVAMLRKDTAELWRRTPQGIGLERVFHPEKHVVEYTPGELKTLQREPDWQALATLFDERALSSLKAGPRQRQLQAYHGTFNGEKVELVWDHGVRLPKSLHRLSPSGRVSLTLLGTAPAKRDAPAWQQWARLGEQIAGYQRLDAADFGDMAQNAVVRKAESIDIGHGWRRPHAHE